MPNLCEDCGERRAYRGNTRCRKCRLKPSPTCTDCDAPRDGYSKRCVDCKRKWNSLMMRTRRLEANGGYKRVSCPRCQAPQGLISQDGMTICETCGFMPDDPVRVGAWVVVSQTQRNGVRKAVSNIKDWADANGLEIDISSNSMRDV